MSARPAARSSVRLSLGRSTGRGSVLLLGLALACGDDKSDDTDTSGTTGGGGPDDTSEPGDTDTPAIVHESGFGLTTDDGPLEASRTSTAEYAVHIDADTVGGFVRYSEQAADGTETCAAVLTVRPSPPSIDPHVDTGDPADPAAPPCTDCSVYHFGHTDLTVTSGTCTFGSTLTGLDQARSLELVSTELLFMVDTAGTGLTVEVREYGAEPSTAGLELPILAAGSATFDGSTLAGTNSETTTTALPWLDCAAAGYGTTNTLVPGQLSLSETLACPDGGVAGDGAVDVWEHQIEFGETLNVGVASADPGVALYLRAPSGCLIDLVPTATGCLGSTSDYCQSIEHTATVGGLYGAVVVSTACSTDGTAYAFDARVQ